jgi:hypothetical protein
MCFFFKVFNFLFSKMLNPNFFILFRNTYTTAEWNNVSYGLSFFVGSFLITMRCLNLGMVRLMID